MNQLSRDCIECDAEGCHNRSPQLTCRFCNAYYFCSEACRIRGADHPCFNEEEIAAEQTLHEGTFRTDQEAIESARNTRCGICLESNLVDPIVLSSCQHKFCSPCLAEWTSQSETCPFCRSDTDDLNNHRAILIQVLGRRAAIAPNEETKHRLLTRALQKAEELVEAAGRGPKTLLLKMKVQSRIQGMERLALETGDEIQRLLDERQHEVVMMQYIAEDQALDEHYHILSRVLMGNYLFQSQVNIVLGEIYKSMQEWQEAIQHFERVLNENRQGVETDEESFVCCRGVYWRLVRCYYEIGDYDRAIATAEQALGESRHKLEVHKYMALSYKTNGDPYMALKVMHRGVLYTLDNGDRQQAYDLYEELRREMVPWS